MLYIDLLINGCWVTQGLNVYNLVSNTQFSVFWTRDPIDKLLFPPLTNCCGPNGYIDTYVVCIYKRAAGVPINAAKVDAVKSIRRNQS